jgi:transcriptional regulator with XRE-family HTH domain
MKISELLKETRKSANLTQKQLADKSGVSFVSINRIEGGAFPRLSVLQKLFTAMNKKLNFELSELEVNELA